MSKQSETSKSEVQWSIYRQRGPYTDDQQDEGLLSPVSYELDLLVAPVISGRTAGQVSAAAFNTFLLTQY